MLKRLLEISIAPCLLCLTGCASMMPDMVKMVSEIEDTAVKVEVNRDALTDGANIKVDVEVINKHPPAQ